MRRAPFLTFAMAVFVLSLVGIPPLVGYLGKLYVFAAAIERGLYALALAGARSTPPSAPTTTSAS